MTFYHGTNVIIYDIDFTKSNLRTDFGRGFYMGSKLGEARKWAIGKAGFSGIPTIMRYSVKNEILHDICVNPLRFDLPNEKWLNFVKENRRKSGPHDSLQEPRHSYGAVSGPIANDKVNIVIAKYCNGEISEDEALKMIRIVPSVFQLSLHTSLALSYIVSVEYQQRQVDGKWTDWQYAIGRSQG